MAGDRQDAECRAVVIGAGGGIGAALVAGLRARGWAVEALARPAIDIEDEASIAAAAADVAARGPVQRVIVATGLLQGRGATPEKTMRALSGPALATYFAVNATGPALVAKHFLPLLPRQEPAVFAALSARVGSIGDNRLGGWYGYRASKAALNMLVRSLAIELARGRPDAICVALHPGTVDTALSRDFQRGVAPGKLFTPAVAAAHLLDVLDRLGPGDSGGCFAWDGARITP